MMGELVPEYIVRLGTCPKRFCCMGEFKLLLGLVPNGEVWRGLFAKLLWYDSGDGPNDGSAE